MQHANINNELIKRRLLRPLTGSSFVHPKPSRVDINLSPATFFILANISPRPGGFLFCLSDRSTSRPTTFRSLEVTFLHLPGCIVVQANSPPNHISIVKLLASSLKFLLEKYTLIYGILGCKSCACFSTRRLYS